MKRNLRLLLLSCSALGLFEIAKPDRARAVSPAPEWQNGVDELIRLAEAAESNPKQAAWQEVKESLKNAARQSSSAQGFFLSAQTILNQWTEGRGLRLVSSAQPQFYAYHSQPPKLREVGAWFAQKGAKWYVKQLSSRPRQPLQRGDAILLKEFHPVLSWSTGGSTEIEIQTDLLATPKKVKLEARATDLSAWALKETQAASKVLPLENKRICQEKAWLWLTAPVTRYLQSKISAAQKTCDALLVDLRDSFGETLPSGPFKAQEKDETKPLVVLVNQQTSEQAVSLALKLKEELGATVIGEPTSSRLLPQKKHEMKELPWLLLVYEKSGGSLLPDMEVRDSWLLTAGYDEVYEAGIKQLKAALKI